MAGYPFGTMKTTAPSIAETISQGGRTGTVETSETGFKLQLTEADEHGQGLTPEHLFGAAWAACFHSAVLHCASESKLNVEGTTVTARVKLQPEEERPFEVELSVSLPGMAEDKARQVLARANEMCPYSRATRSHVNVKTTLN